MNTEFTRPHLLIALPKLLCFKELFKQTIDGVLQTIGDADVSLVSDRDNEAGQILRGKGINAKEVRILTRSNAQTAIKEYSHVLAFWDGDDPTDIVYFAKLYKKHLRIVQVRITKVRNKNHNEEFDVYIGRGTLWGNPFPIEHETDRFKRKVVIEKYKEYFIKEIVSKPEKLKLLLTLKGLRLGCHCSPLPCHGDVIADYLNSLEDELVEPQENFLNSTPNTGH